MGTISIFSIIAVTILSRSQARVYKLPMTPDNRYIAGNSYDTTYNSNDDFARDNIGIHRGNYNVGHSYDLINRLNDNVGLNNDKIYAHANELIPDSNRIFGINQFGPVNDIFHRHNTNFGPNNQHAMINGFADYNHLDNIFKGRNNNFGSDHDILYTPNDKFGHDNDIINDRNVDYVRLLNYLIKSRDDNFGYDLDIINSRDDDFARHNDMIGFGYNDYIGRNNNKDINIYKGKSKYDRRHDDGNSGIDIASGADLDDKCKAALLAIIEGLQAQEKVNPFTNLFVFKGKRKDKVLWRKWLDWNKENGAFGT